MGETGKTIASGVILIGVITAFGLHSQGLASVGKTGLTGFRGVLSTAETGKTNQ